ncbi:MAG TPA: hypothetical protein VK465_09915, partial [Fibrobacteria bacterium]|nr:hypothetical protein [Fibrobacteria bacterium]
MLRHLFLLSILAVMSWSAVPIYRNTASLPCLEKGDLKSLYFDGDLDRLNQLMEEFRAFVINTETPVPLPCWIPIATFSAVTAISMEQDTAKAKVFFASILKMDPRL